MLLFSFDKRKRMMTYYSMNSSLGDMLNHTAVSHSNMEMIISGSVLLNSNVILKYGFTIQIIMIIIDYFLTSTLFLNCYCFDAKDC